MNRYHLCLLFTIVSVILLFSVKLSSDRILEQQAADRETETTLRFAIGCATNALSKEYGGANDCQKISSTFFKALSLFEDNRSILNGRISPEDFYPYVPALVYIEERYYHIGYFDGTKYIWDSEKPYTENYNMLSEISSDELLFLLEQEVNAKIALYHTNKALPDIDYTLPDYISRNPKEGTILAVLENFPTIVNGYYYSGIYDSSGSIMKKVDN